VKPTPILALALLLLAGVGTIVHAPRARAVRKTTIDVLPTGFRAGTLTVASDGSAHAYVAVEPAGERVVGSAGKGELHDACVKPSFAPHAARLFYWAADLDLVARRGVLSIVADEQPFPTELNAPGALVHSDAERWAVVGFLPDVAPGEPGDVAVIVDGKEYVRAPDVSLPSLSRDGAHLAYLVKDDDRSVLVVDGDVQRTFDAPASSCARQAAEAVRGRPDLLGRHVVRYLADGSLLVATREANGWGVYHDETRVAAYQRATVDAARVSS
jgi:hypothetical protein